ncbi:methyltransferase domain-containing protein [Blastochloris sulfoviridis]|uniref:Class I SAM-dependent methyltransferase n=1 Tax=Blastochloris sulfoviridis TaxID=50712 RepID=A0A5M6HNI1_9HYPH|nr:methyltransferase domain-containing protein [Blastochloris sulfoviridis]KAA5597159.1 class I SAM-dependent methyltransferase [Blastochloris sulfoviridis]
MTFEKFGKSFRDIADLKTSFFEDNGKWLERALKYAAIYTAQPRRTHCKICNAPLPGTPSFVKHTIPYVICTRCSHLNGMHEDSDAFCEAVYTSDEGKDYAEAYSSADAAAYVRRRERIYEPKARFLLDVLRHENKDPAALRYADMGAGAGYFVAALQELGLTQVAGYEVGQAQVALGNWMMPSAPLSLIGLKDTLGLCREIPADVMTFIGVFEHLQNPREILGAVRSNPAVRYVYICVPMFAPTIYNEMVFPQVMPRQLAVGHTHLFTDASIRNMEAEFGLERVGAWWFGTDMMDYHRSVLVSLAQTPGQAGMIEPWREQFEDILDDLQLVIDKKRKSSQIHAVFKVRR